MCYIVVLASDHPFPVIPFVKEQPAFNAESLPEGYPAKKWLSKPYQVRLGSRNWCACGLDFNLTGVLNPEEPPAFTTEFTPEMWAYEVQEFHLNKKCLEAYYAYLRAMLALGDLEWYCCWDGDWDTPPVCRLQFPASILDGEPDFEKNHPLDIGLYVYYEAAK